MTQPNKPMVWVAGPSTAPPKPATPPVEPPKPRVAMAAWYLYYNEKNLWNLPLSAFLLACVILILYRGTREDAEANLAASRAKYVAMAPPFVPDTENAWLHYAAAGKAYTAWAGNEKQNPSGYDKKQRLPWDDPQIDEFILSNQACFTEIVAATSKPGVDFKTDYSGVLKPTPHLSLLRKLTRLLAVKSLNDGAHGRHILAAESIKRILAIARHLDSDPVLIDGMVATAVRGIGSGYLKQILRDFPPRTATDLDGYRSILVSELERDPNSVQLSQMLMTEKWWGQIQIDTQAVKPVVLGGGLLTPEFGIAHLSQPLVARCLWYSAEKATHASAMDELISKASSYSPPENSDVFVSRHKRGPAVFTPMLVDVVNGGINYHWRIKDPPRVLDTALAFLQFRIKYGQDAQRLEDLVPEFLPAIPTDAIHHLPLILRFEPTRVLIYTRGLNGRDDQGVDNESQCDDWSVELPLISGGAP